MQENASPSAFNPNTLPAAFRHFFTFRSPRTLAAYGLLAVLIRSALGPWRWRDAVAIGCIAAIWPLLEWAMHRHLLHWKPIGPVSKALYPLFARFHVRHHRDPSFWPLVFFPYHVVLGLPLTGVIVGAITGSIETGLSGWLGFCLVGLVYEWTHYLTHTNVRPRSAYYRKIWLGHRMHHYRNEKYWFSFTVPNIDRLMRTGPDPRTVPVSPNCHDLGMPDLSRHAEEGNRA